MVRWLGIACLLCITSACDGFTEVDGGPAGDGARDLPAGQEQVANQQDLFAPGGTGAGPYGALPSGYCCTADSDCRDRNCQALNGGQVCLDSCLTNAGCQGPVPGLHCNQTAGYCEPDDSAFTCVSADQFSYGAKQLGACCLATHNAWAGFECQGNRCSAFHEDSNPYICTHVCMKTTDCPGAYQCMGTGEGFGLCAPQATTYTCP